MSKHTPGRWTAQPDPNGIITDWMIGIEGGIVDEIAVCEERNARLIAAAPDMYALAQRVARLNPDAGEIGPGMLAQLVAEARRIVGEA